MKLTFSILLILFLNIHLNSKPTTETESKYSTKSIWDEIMKQQSMLNTNKGIIYFEKQNYEKASIEFLKAINNHPNPVAYTLYGASLYWLGDVDASIENYNKAIELDPKYDIAYQLRGISYARKREIEKALEDFKKAEELNPYRSDVLMNIGSVYFSLNKIQDSVYYFKKALKLSPSNPLYHYQLGLVYYYTYDYEKARDEFLKAVAIKKDYEDAVLWLALTYERVGKMEEAIKYYKKAISIKEFDNFARYKLARLLNKKNLKFQNYLDKFFLLTPANKRGGVSLNLSYSYNSFSKKSKDPVENMLRENLSRLGSNDKIELSVDIIEMPDIILQKKTEKFKNMLENRFSPVNIKIINKSYILKPTSQLQREKEINRIINEIKKTIKDNPEKYRVNININSVKTDTPQNRAEYVPRNVGNDMGLWIIGNNWINEVDEDLSEINYNKLNSSENLIYACANLLTGNIETAEDLFKKSEDNFPVLSKLGLSVVYYIGGDTEKALKLLKTDTLKNNKIALENLRWINGDK